MFGFKKNVDKQHVKDLENKIEELRKSKNKLVEEVAELKLQKKMDEEDIKHMHNIQKEQLEIEKQKEIAKIKAEADERVADVKDDYRDKMEKQLTNETKNIKEMYDKIFERLPNMNVHMKGSI